MSTNLISDDGLRAALRPFRANAETFEARVRKRFEERENDETADGPSRVLRAASVFLPLELLTGQATSASAKAAPLAGGAKWLGYVAFPAISLFVLVGASIVSAISVRRSSARYEAMPHNPQTLTAATSKWWQEHKWGAYLVYGVTLGLMMIGVTGLVFLFYVISLGLVAFMLASLARQGLGNRLIVGQSGATGLMILAQMSQFSGIGNSDIHLLDQAVVGSVFYVGTFLVWMCTINCMEGYFTSEHVMGRNPQAAKAVMFVAISAATLPLAIWFLHPLIWPATPAKIKHYVESFDRAPNSTSSWSRWEIVASWTIERELHPDLTRPRELLDQEIAGEQSFLILNDAFRVGLVSANQAGKLKDYQNYLGQLLAKPVYTKEPQAIMTLGLFEWVIQAAVLRDELNDEQRDFLAARLNATFEDSLTRSYLVLETPLRITQLLEVIDRPVDAERYRARVHALLRRFHSLNTGGFQPAGGFKAYATSDTGHLMATAQAVLVMQIYGIPDGLELDWVRSYLRPKWNITVPERWITAVTLDRLNQLPGATYSSWYRVLYYERSLCAAFVLVALCVYATLVSPKPRQLPPPERLALASE